MTRLKQSEILFDEWQKAQANETDEAYLLYHKRKKGTAGYIPKQNFFSDGIFFEDLYNKANRKILFIAKECNAYQKKDLIKEDIHKSCSSFWAKNQVEEAIKGSYAKNNFIKGLAMIYNAIENDDYSNPNKDISSLSNAAFMNLNKRGGYERCVCGTLEGYVDKYKDFISEQIKLIDPDVIVCCSENVKNLVEAYNLVDNEGIVIKCAYHPSCFSISDKEKLRFLQPNY